MPGSPSAVRQRLRHVYWIGGGSGAGKSTVARRLAAEYGLRHYATDDVMREHLDRLSPQAAPQMHAFAAMDFDERWLHRSPAVMLDTFGWFHGEGFELIIDDLLAMPRHTGVVVEGFRLLPELVEPLLTDASRAVWLLPSADFRMTALASRGGLWDIAGRTSDPPAALAKLLERDDMFTRRVAGVAADRGLSTLSVDSTLSVAELTAMVSEACGLSTMD